jgi:hypothetical protein
MSFLIVFDGMLPCQRMRYHSVAVWQHAGKERCVRASSGRAHANRKRQPASVVIAHCTYSRLLGGSGEESGIYVSLHKKKKRRNSVQSISRPPKCTAFLPFNRTVAHAATAGVVAT